jgi:signal transduction histidine kinase
LNYSVANHELNDKKEWVYTKPFVTKMTNLLTQGNNVSILLKTSVDKILVPRTILYHILINLLSNAVKYNDKDYTIIEVSIEELDDQYLIIVSDNGPGIPVKNHDKIFDLFTGNLSVDKFGETGNGLGLGFVKKLVAKAGGTIELSSEIGNGTKFIFTFQK